MRASELNRQSSFVLADVFLTFVRVRRCQVFGVSFGGKIRRVTIFSGKWKMLA